MDLRHAELLTPRDLLEKLNREVVRFELDSNADNLFNLMVTAWHLIDWLRADPLYKASLPFAQSVDHLQNDPVLQICRDLCNAHKHAVLTYSPKYPPSVTKVEPMEGRYGEMRYGEMRYGELRTFIIEDKHGNRHNAKIVAATAIALYENLFTTHGL